MLDVGYKPNKARSCFMLGLTFGYRRSAKSQKRDDAQIVHAQPVDRNLAKHYHHNLECIALPYFIPDRNTRRNFCMEMLGGHTI